MPGAGMEREPRGEKQDDMKGTPSGEKPDKEGGAPSGEKPDGKDDAPDGQAADTSEEEAAQYAADGVERDTSASENLASGTYDTAEEYIEALNADGEWISYDADKKQVSISSIADFVSACKKASKSLGAFDQLDASQAENTLFAYGDGEGAHFDSILSKLLSENDYGKDYTESYNSDLAKKDTLGNTVDYRSNMYNPLYFINDYYDGYKTASVAKYFRIRTGINQSDTALTTEINLALALQNYGVNVDFATVWGQGHTQAETEGNSTTNFIEWVNECLTR